MSEACSPAPSVPHFCAAEGKAGGWLATSGQTHRDARSCERSYPSQPQRQRHSADDAAGQFVDPWRGC